MGTLSSSKADLERLALSHLSELPSTIGSVTRKLGGWPQVDGREVRLCLDALVAAGEADYIDGSGNNRRYRRREANHAS